MRVLKKFMQYLRTCHVERVQSFRKNEMKNNDINDLAKNIIKQYENDNTSTENKVTPIGFIIDK